MPESTTRQIYEQAVRLHQAGKLREAEALYREVLKVEPYHADAVHFLGVVSYQLGNIDWAVELIQRAIALNPSATVYQNNFAVVLRTMATVLREKGRTDEAIAAYRRLLAIAPDDAGALNDLGNLLAAKGEMDESISVHRRAVVALPELPEAHFNLANGLAEKGLREEAIAEYRKAISLRPSFALAHHQLGRTLGLAGRLDEAIAELRETTAMQPDNATAWFDLSYALNSAGREEEAIDACRRSLAIEPGRVEAYVSLGGMLDRSRKYQEAEEVYRRGLAIKADSAELWSNLGSTLHNLERDEESLECYRKAIAIRPDFPEALHNLGNALDRLGRDEEAMQMQRRALSLRPDFPEALNSLGSLLYHERDLAEADRCFRRAIQLSPNYPDARMNLGLLRLIEGDFPQGWQGYEARWELGKLTAPRDFAQPMWDGSDLHGRRIMLHAEQGLGDAIQFLRYVPLVQARGGRVLVRCWAGLKRLFTGQLGIEQVFDEKDPEPEFDVHLPLVSVARVLGTTLQTIPAHGPYLTPDSGLVQQWRQRLSAEPARLKVGLVWAGNPKHARDRSRSIPLSMLAGLGRIEGVRFYSLQKGEAAGQAQNPPTGMGLVDWAGELRDMADTAALVQNLDLVISVDTAVVHLVGALAKPVWVLVTYLPDWRWLLDRTDSPWYPTLRLFRQAQKDDWTEPLNQIAAELSAQARQ